METRKNMIPLPAQLRARREGGGQAMFPPVSMLWLSTKGLTNRMTPQLPGLDWTVFLLWANLERAPIGVSSANK